MSRTPNFSTSQWFQPLDQPLEGALCVKQEHFGLPWTDDAEPWGNCLRQMQFLCEQCPARQRCAYRALKGNNGRGADGGFYAGIWLPWRSRYDTDRTKERRRKARIALRRIAGIVRSSSEDV